LMTKVAKSDMGDQAVLELKTCIRMITWAEVLCQTNTWGRALLRLKACRVPISIWAIAAGPAMVLDNFYVAGEGFEEVPLNIEHVVDDASY
ncbi:hypothetical protein Tco_1471243, partial [Tanacetum coccineum]